MKKIFVTFTIFFISLVVSQRVLAEEKTVTLSIENMTCSLCPVTVKMALNAVKGVHDVSVSFEEENAVVIYDNETVNVEMLIGATTNAGFPSTPSQEDYFNDNEHP